MAGNPGQQGIGELYRSDIAGIEARARLVHASAETRCQPDLRGGTTAAEGEQQDKGEQSGRCQHRAVLPVFARRVQRGGLAGCAR